jgi:hypothetical protein
MMWTPETAESTWHRMAAGVSPWLAVGDFLDDWRRVPCHRHEGLVEAPPRLPEPPADLRWAAFLAGAVEYLLWQDGHPFPGWTKDARLFLDHPWFLYPGWRLRAWQLATTPAAFKVRNIFGGDRILARV